MLFTAWIYGILIFFTIEIWFFFFWKHWNLIYWDYIFNIMKIDKIKFIFYWFLLYWKYNFNESNFNQWFPLFFHHFLVQFGCFATILDVSPIKFKCFAGIFWICNIFVKDCWGFHLIEKKKIRKHFYKPGIYILWYLYDGFDCHKLDYAENWVNIYNIWKSN